MTFESCQSACLGAPAMAIVVRHSTRGEVPHGSRPVPLSSIMPVRLATFGGLGLTSNGSEVQGLASHRIRAALLVYLAVERSATRATLEAVLWPDIDPDSAARRL